MRDVEHDFNLIKPIDKKFGSYLFPTGAPDIRPAGNPAGFYYAIL